MKFKSNYVWKLLVLLLACDYANSFISVNGFPDEATVKNAIAGFVTVGVAAFYILGTSLLGTVLAYSTDQAKQALELEAFVKATGKLPNGSPPPTPAPPGPRRPGNRRASNIPSPYPYYLQAGDQDHISSYTFYDNSNHINENMINRRSGSSVSISELESRASKLWKRNPRSIEDFSLYDPETWITYLLKADVNSCFAKMACEINIKFTSREFSSAEYLFLTLFESHTDSTFGNTKENNTDNVDCEKLYPDCPNSNILPYMWSMGLQVGSVLKSVRSFNIL